MQVKNIVRDFNTLFTVNQATIDLAAATLLLAATCYYIPQTVPLLIGAQTLKFTTCAVLSYLESNNYISGQFYKSARIALDPTWPLIFSLCKSKLMAVLPGFIGDEPCSVFSALSAFAPHSFNSYASYFAQDSIPKIAAACTSGFISPLAVKTLDKLSKPIYNYIEQTLIHRVLLQTASVQGNLILPSIPSIFLTQSVSEFFTPLGNFARGFFMTLASLSTSSAEPRIENNCDLMIRCFTSGMCYAFAKGAAADIPELPIKPVYLKGYMKDQLYFTTRRFVES